MINREKLNCFTSDLYASVLKENASSTNRGIVGVSWRTLNRAQLNDSILTLHGKVRNAFMEYYG